MYTVSAPFDLLLNFPETFSKLKPADSQAPGPWSMGNRRTEQSQEDVLYGSRQSGGFVNSTVKVDKLTSFRVCRLFPMWT